MTSDPLVTQEGGPIMQMPQPTDEHRRLGRLPGTWVSEDTMYPSPWDPKGGTAKGRMTAHMGLGGFHLISDWGQERDGRVNFEGHGVFGWDPRGKCQTMHWLDSMGVEHGAPHFGAWEGNTLTLTHKTTHMGFRRQVYDVGERGFRLRLEYSQDGRQWATFLESAFRPVD